MKYTGIFYF